MSRFILEKILQNRSWVISFFLGFSLLGAWSMLSLPIDAVPDITNVQVMINAKTGALDPEQIEKTITYSIETEMAGLPGLKDIRSLSKYGLSQVVLVFGDKADLYFVRQQVSQRLQNLKDHLPEGVTPELAPTTTGLGEIVMYTVTAKEGSMLSEKSEDERLLYLRTIQDFVIRPELKKIVGIAEIDSSGGYRKEIHVNAEPQKMEKFGLSFEELLRRLKTIGDSYGGGYIQKEGKQVIVRTTSDFEDIQKIGQIPVRLDLAGRPIRLNQVANIREDHTQRIGAATFNGKETVLGTALMSVGANSREVSLDIEDAISKLKLPEGVQVNIVYTRSFLVNETIKTVAKSLAEGAALVVAVLLLLLGSFRAAIVVSLAIPISMLFAITGMKFFGVSANLMILGAIDFGLLVDGSVVLIENLLRRLGQQAGPMSIQQRLEIAIESSVEVAKPVLLGLFLIMVVYFPVLALEGIEGKMFHPMAMTVLMALGASLLVAFFLMPVLGYLVLRAPTQEKHRDSFLFGWIQKIYHPVLIFGIRSRVLVVSVTIVIAMISGFLFTKLGSDFIPQLDEGDLVAGLVRDPSMSLEKSIEEQKKAEKIIREFAEVETVFSRMGTPESATDPMGVNFADTFIILKKDPRQWPEVALDGGFVRRRSKDELMQAISERIQKDLPGHEVSPTQPIAMRFNEILEGSRADIALRIFGPSLDRLVEYIDASKEIVEKISGTREAEMDSLTALRKSPMMNVALDFTALSRFGITIQEANTALMVAMGGTQIGNFYEIDRRFPIILHLDEKLRDSENEIRRIPIALSS